MEAGSEGWEEEEEEGRIRTRAKSKTEGRVSRKGMKTK